MEAAASESWKGNGRSWAGNGPCEGLWEALWQGLCSSPELLLLELLVVAIFHLKVP